MATPTPIYRYPLDGTGVSPDNLVVGEEHQLSTRAVRCVAPIYGGFFAESVLVKDFATNQTLVRGVDYVFGELFEFPTGRYGKEIFGIIAITKPGVTKISINYQALGGDYSYSMDAIIAMLDSLNLGERPVEWGSIINRPTMFDPATHFHDIGDVYGFEYIVHAIERLRFAVLTGDVASHDEIYRYIDKTAKLNSDATAAVAKDLADHEADKTNPHVVTKAQVGLGVVENYATASQTDMDTGTAANLYLTPNIVAKYVTDKAVTPLNNHIGNKSNPHAVTKAQVGLGSVENYPPATDTIALTGTSTAHYMTPANVAHVVKTRATDPLAAHVANTSNPHSVTKTQVGLSNVLNYGVATQSDMDAGTSNSLYVTPMTVAKYVTDRAITPLNTHIGRVDNPHATTKAQVGLGSVENYPPATNDIAFTGTSTSHYITPANLTYVMDSKMSAPLSDHINNKNNPHAVTKSQVGLGNVQDYGVATNTEAQAGTTGTKYLTPSNLSHVMALHRMTPGEHDAHYVRLDAQVRASIHVREDLNTAYIWVNGAWRQFWPPLWQ